MKKIILLISIFFIGLTGIHSNEVQVLDDSQNIYNVNFSFSQNEELFSKEKVIDFKKNNHLTICQTILKRNIINIKE